MLNLQLVVWKIANAGGLFPHRLPKVAHDLVVHAERRVRGRRLFRVGGPDVGVAKKRVPRLCVAIPAVNSGVPLKPQQLSAREELSVALHKERSLTIITLPLRQASPPRVRTTGGKLATTAS